MRRAWLVAVLLVLLVLVGCAETTGPSAWESYAKRCTVAISPDGTVYDYCR